MTGLRWLIAALLAALLAAAPPAPAQTIAQSGGGAGMLLGTAIAAASPTLDFTIGGTYSAVQISCTGIRPATSGAGLFLRVGTGSPPTYQITGYQYAYLTNTSGVVTPAGQGNTADSAINTGAVGLDNSANQSATFLATIGSPALAAMHTIIFTEAGLNTAAGAFINIAGTGAWATATPITGIRFMATAGNITSGQCSLYGLP